MGNGRRALFSVYDKTGLVDFARGLHELGFELVASGGSARALAEAGLSVTPVEEVTDAPEILGGRVKTLHPAIHGAILARDTAEQRAELSALGYVPIDVVACNLYPFVETVSKPDTTEAEGVEQIDIGGVTLLRAAAKNFERVAVVCEPADYAATLEGLRNDSLNRDARRQLALKAFRHTTAYDAAIANWFEAAVSPEEALPEVLHLVATRSQAMRYGENPHQQAALYALAGAQTPFEQLHGNPLSYNNLLDLEAAWAMPGEFTEPAVAIVKHNTPCGLATADDPVAAYEAALECDPVSAFGGIVATNREIDEAFAHALKGIFLEVIVGPSFTPEALAYLSRKKKKCRLIQAAATPLDLQLRSVRGGLLAQTPDLRGIDESSWTVATERAPTEAERRALAFAWIAVKHVRSNAIVFANGTATVGIGGGQTSRVDSVRIAAEQAGDKAKGSVMGSDAFFPFPDGVEAAAAAGVTAVIQPGGSIRDEEVVAAANRLGLAMVFTGERHFRH